jgi:FkbM family methyltransferase
MSHAALRFLAAINRFGTLRLAHRAFAGLPAPNWVSRPLFGGEMHMDLSRSEAQQLLFLEGERFVDERAVLARMLRPGMTVVDVGANIGYYLLLFQQAVGEDGTVICIEPSEENLPELHRNIAANRRGTVLLHEVALGSEEGEIGLRSGINSGVVEVEQAAHVVKIRRLDALVSERVDMLKIDVEGYEGQVLAGAGALLERDRPAIFLELHPHIIPRFGYSLRGILADLGKYYRDIRLYEKRDDHGSLAAKLAVRYLGADGLVEVADREGYVRRYTDNPDSHTFWAVCLP